jgi:hypothetical protein
LGANVVVELDSESRACQPTTWVWAIIRGPTAAGWAPTSRSASLASWRDRARRVCACACRFRWMATPLAASAMTSKIARPLASVRSRRLDRRAASSSWEANARLAGGPAAPEG